MADKEEPGEAGRATGEAVALPAGQPAPATAGGAATIGAPVPREPAPNPFAGLDPELLNRSLEGATTVSVSSPNGLVRRWQMLRAEWLPNRIPLLVVTVFLAIIAIPRTTSSVISALDAHPAAGPLALLLWAAYAFPLIWLVTRFDFFERAPWTLLAGSLAWGGLIATGVALQANQAIYSVLTATYGEEFSQEWGPAIAAPLTEESLKTIGIIWAVLMATRRIRSAIDGFVVGAMVGVGFQVVENFIYTGNVLAAPGPEGDEVRGVLTVFFVRGIASGLWSHAAYSGFVGLGIGFLFTRPDIRLKWRMAAAIGMFLIAVALHSLWNTPVLIDVPLWLSMVLKGALIVGLVLFAIFRLQSRDSSIYTEYLEALADPEIATESEIADLRNSQTREAAVMRAEDRGGTDAGEAVRQLHRAQADLSVALAVGDISGVTAGRAAVVEARRTAAAVALLPRRGGHDWGVAAIWLSILGVLVPVFGALLALVVAAVGTQRTRRSGLKLDDSLRAAWVLAGISLVVGLVLLQVLSD